MVHIHVCGIGVRVRCWVFVFHFTFAIRFNAVCARVSYCTGIHTQSLALSHHRIRCGCGTIALCKLLQLSRLRRAQKIKWKENGKKQLVGSIDLWIVVHDPKFALFKILCQWFATSAGASARVHAPHIVHITHMTWHGIGIAPWNPWAEMMGNGPPFYAYRKYIAPTTQ